MRRPSRLFSVGLCAVLAIAGCASDDDDDDQSATTGQPASPDCPSGLTKTEEICVDNDDPQASQIVDAVRSQFTAGVLSGVVFGVWRDGAAVATGALGVGQSGVPATRDMHFRIGNVLEEMLTTQLLRLVEEGEIALDDPISNWFPELPNADKVTVNMLAHSTSGYNDFVTTQAFIDAFDKDPFKIWELDELIDIAMSKPPLFDPGTNWAFSDTNFVLLGQIVQEVGGQPFSEQVQEIWDELEMDNTAISITSVIEPPVMHAYSNERGPFEDVTFWSPSWVPNAGNGTSNLDDMAVWAEALAEGTVLSAESHELQLAPTTAGLGPMTEDSYYAMATAVSSGWVGTNPQVDGYSGIVAYHPEQEVTVVVFATIGPDGDIATAYATGIYGEITNVVTPGEKLPFEAQPRGPSGDD
jgi:D-alanyl-D-alanine carboxypeptidase